ncbi:MAG: glycosyltransferase family 4 protein [Deltaproteobacteria bacterium]|nr:glycosyltransferase family 4 protein [Deltaproteobacteria bacterium]
MTPPRLRVGLLATHPIQYYVPWYRLLAQQVDLEVCYCQQLTPRAQAVDFGGAFAWDVPLLEGYHHRFLVNRARQPNVSAFFGCDTPEIGRLIAQEKFDAFIVHGWALKSFWQAILACWHTRTPVLVRGDSQLPAKRGGGLRALKFPLYRWFIPRFDGYLVVGERAGEYLRYYGARSERMFFSPHAVDNEFFARRAAVARSTREERRRSWGLPSDAVVYLFAGKCVARKHLEDFVRAIATASRGQSRVWGLVVGDGPLRAPLEAQARRQGWPLRFVGFLNQTEIPTAYAVSDALVLPSDATETWGLVVNEAMASGLPAFVSDQVGCAPDLILPEQTGHVFPCGQVDSLAELMLRHADLPTSLATLGAHARLHIQRYSLAQAVEGTLAAFHAVGTGRAAPHDWRPTTTVSEERRLHG